MQTGQAGGTFGAPIHYPSPYALNPATELDDDGANEDFYSVPSVGDFNGDGQLDIAVPDPSGAIQLLLSTCGQPTGDLSVAVQDSADPVAEGAPLSYTLTRDQPRSDDHLGRDVDRLRRRSGWSPRCGAGALYLGDGCPDVCGRGSIRHVPAADARGGRNDSA